MPSPPMSPASIRTACDPGEAVLPESADGALARVGERAGAEDCRASAADADDVGLELQCVAAALEPTSQPATAMASAARRTREQRGVSVTRPFSCRPPLLLVGRLDFLAVSLDHLLGDVRWHVLVVVQGGGERTPAAGQRP
jgi:hypothetical protein